MKRGKMSDACAGATSREEGRWSEEWRLNEGVSLQHCVGASLLLRLQAMGRAARD